MKLIINFLVMSTLCSLIMFSSCGDDDDPVFDLTQNADDEVTAVLDADSDGIADDDDTFGDTPSGATVNSNGCSDSQIDTDLDGITDDLDICVDTAEGTDVDEDGCAIIIDDFAETECTTSTAANDIAVIACKYYNDEALTVVVGETTITIT